MAAVTTGSIWTLLIPVYVLGFLILLLALVALLGRIQGGRYLRPVIAFVSKVPLFKRGITKATKAALEKQNPELASAMEKMERYANVRDPQKAQQAMSRLTASERRAWMDAAQEQGAGPDLTSLGRAERRRLERMQKQGRRGGR